MERPARLLALLLALTAPALARPLAPRPGDALIDEASRKLEAGDAQGALPLLLQAQHAAPRDPRPHYLRGVALSQTDPAGAIAAFRAALALDRSLANVHSELGALLLDTGKLDEARGEIKTAVDLDPRLAEGWVNLAKVESRRNRLDAALAAYREAEKLLPSDAEVRTDHAMALRRAGRIDDAVRAAREAVALDGKSAPAHQALGFALQSAGHLDDAVASFTAATRLDPRSQGALWALGIAERDRKHVDAAIAALIRACAMECKPPLAIDIASVQMQAGQTERALETLQAAIARHPRSLLLQIELAKTLAAARRCDQARQTIGKLPPQPAVTAAAAAVDASCGKRTL